MATVCGIGLQLVVGCTSANGGLHAAASGAAASSRQGVLPALCTSGRVPTIRSVPLQLLVHTSPVLTCTPHSLLICPAAVDYLATRGYDPAFGARPVKRVVQQELETALAKGILRGDFAVSLCRCCGAAHSSKQRAVGLMGQPGHVAGNNTRHSLRFGFHSGPTATFIADPCTLPPCPPMQEEDTVVVEAPGGAQATHLVVYRKGSAAGHRVEQGDNAAELAV